MLTRERKSSCSVKGEIQLGKGRTLSWERESSRQTPRNAHIEEHPILRGRDRKTVLLAPLDGPTYVLTGRGTVWDVALVTGSLRGVGCSIVFVCVVGIFILSGENSLSL